LQRLPNHFELGQLHTRQTGIGQLPLVLCHRPCDPLFNTPLRLSLFLYFFDDLDVAAAAVHVGRGFGSDGLGEGGEAQFSTAARLMREWEVFFIVLVSV